MTVSTRQRRKEKLMDRCENCFYYVDDGRVTYCRLTLEEVGFNDYCDEFKRDPGVEIDHAYETKEGK